jgi:hypothetical protein
MQGHARQAGYTALAYKTKKKEKKKKKIVPPCKECMYRAGLVLAGLIL